MTCPRSSCLRHIYPPQASSASKRLRLRHRIFTVDAGELFGLGVLPSSWDLGFSPTVLGPRGPHIGAQRVHGSSGRARVCLFSSPQAVPPPLCQGFLPLVLHDCSFQSKPDIWPLRAACTRGCGKIQAFAPAPATASVPTRPTARSSLTESLSHCQQRPFLVGWYMLTPAHFTRPALGTPGWV